MLRKRYEKFKIKLPRTMTAKEVSNFVSVYYPDYRCAIHPEQTGICYLYFCSHGYVNYGGESGGWWFEQKKTFKEVIYDEDTYFKIT